jgi:hypothetical protein
MRRVILLISAAVLLVSDTGCAKDKEYARRYAPAYYDAAPCGCDGAVGPVDGVVVPGPVGVSPQAVGAITSPVGQTITSTPIHAGAGY